MEDRRRTAPLLRPLMVIVAVVVVWYGASALLHFFDRSVDRKTATSLEVRSTDGVQVSLQGQDWQPGESGLRLYAGDAVSTRSAADAVLRFFDGTRIRLDGNSDVQLVRSDRQTDGTSTLTFKVRSGRIWVASPLPSVFTGAIMRTVQTTNYDATIPAATNALVSATLLNVLRASGQGLTVTVDAKDAPSLVVGEGQTFSLEGSAKSAIEQGGDPYEFRDPVTAQLLKDEFLTSSYALFLADKGDELPSGSGTSSSVGDTGEPLTVTTPQNRDAVTQKFVTVSGRVSDRVTDLLVNGQSVNIRKDQSFSVDVSLSKDASTLITVEAQDAQGITLGKVERSVVNAYKIVVEPARIKSPVGSGQTLTTSEKVIEITGEAPPNTAAILVNDYKLQLFKPGGLTWSYLANANYGNLLPGENTFSVVAVDSDGNRSVPRSIKVIYAPEGSTGSGTTTSVSTEPPIKQNPPIEPGSLTVEQPSAGTSAETSDNELSLTGKTSPRTYSISVNGYTLSLYQPGSTSWKYIASTNLQTMKRGKNVYRIVTRNVKGEILDILEYTLTFRP